MKRLLSILLLGYLGICLLMFLLQEKLIFFPGPPPKGNPADGGLDYSDVHVITRDGVAIHGWWIPQEDAQGAVLVAHGNAGNIEQRLGLARAFRSMGYSVLLFDYRGYGNSTGSPSEDGVYLDAEAAYDYLVQEKKHAPSQIVLYGESLGGAVAIELALRRDCLAVITESAFTSLPDVAAHHYPWLPARWLARARFDNATKLPRIDCPYLVIHGPDDEIVPFTHSETLFELANEPKARIDIHGGHNDGGFQIDRARRKQVEAFLVESWLRRNS